MKHRYHVNKSKLIIIHHKKKLVIKKKVKERGLSNKLIEGIVTDDSVRIETCDKDSDSDEDDDSEDKPVSLKMLYKSLGNVALKN
jgi:hypothetical protein